MMNASLISHQIALELEEVRAQYFEAIREREDFFSVKSKVHFAIEHYKEQREAIKASMRKKTYVPIEITTYDFNYSGNPAIPETFRKPSDNYQEQLSTFQIKESTYPGLLSYLNGINREIMEKRLLFKEIRKIIDSIDLIIEALEKKAIELNIPNIAHIEESSKLTESDTVQKDNKAEPQRSEANEPDKTNEITMRLALHGQKFLGKRLNEDTVRAYKNIFKGNDKYKELYGRDNFRKNSLKAAYCDMGYIYEEEKESFYNNFKKFRSRNKLENAEDFERYLKENGYYTKVP